MSLAGDRWSQAEARLARLGVKPQDLDENFTRSGGPGGQNVNKVETSVELRHRPTGVTVTCQAHRSQAQNRLLARFWLAEKLETLARERAARLRHEAERLRRQRRGRSKASKARMLADKRQRAQVKRTRSRPSLED